MRARLRVFKLLTWKLRVLRRYSFFSDWLEKVALVSSELVSWWEIECNRRRLRSCWCSRYKPTASLWASLMHVCVVISETEPSRLKTSSFREISSTPKVGFSDWLGYLSEYPNKHVLLHRRDGSFVKHTRLDLPDMFSSNLWAISKSTVSVYRRPSVGLLKR